jgi:hypothetical protein
VADGVLRGGGVVGPALALGVGAALALKLGWLVRGRGGRPVPAGALGRLVAVEGRLVEGERAAVARCCVFYSARG